ncbi:hypothetical protein MAPG_05135 [Magnaporthiopsis poae ATCC 64411]|uniref:Nudix hydrolase domain-containing protein n=1 Tax=Magnaporthiopsis poae (strain ATCC 64411 / 73-15) TaxID=644358 RepID=A0A0C4DYL0_MAGP6|nr:hypothetical protein MAPG_05135 [Magnaporthiopsis poae ATCC 64411]
MSTDSINRPRVGVAAVIARSDGTVILGRRKGSQGSGQWAFPGGHLEFGESILGCAERETLEETGLHVRGVKIAAVANSIFTDTQLHYVTLFVQCEARDPSKELVPQVTEPDKCEGWTWRSWTDIKKMADEDQETERLFLPIINLVREHPNFGQAGS